MQDTDVVWQNCQWRFEGLCLLRVKLGLLEVSRVSAEPLAPHALLRRLLETTTDDDLTCPADGECNCPFLVRPKYDSHLGELSVNGFVILRLERRRNRHELLRAFEEQGWPSWIETPLHTDCDNSLHDVIYGVNRGQNPWLIDFSSDGTGGGVRWEFIR